MRPSPDPGFERPYPHESDLFTFGEEQRRVAHPDQWELGTTASYGYSYGLGFDTPGWTSSPFVSSWVQPEYGFDINAAGTLDRELHSDFWGVNEMSGLDQCHADPIRKSTLNWNRAIPPSRYQPHETHGWEALTYSPACVIPSIEDRKTLPVDPLYKALLAPPASGVDLDMGFGMNSNPRAPDGDHTTANSVQDLDSKEDLVLISMPSTLPNATAAEPTQTVRATANAKPCKPGSSGTRKRRTCHDTGNGDENGRPKPSKKQIFACPYFRMDPIRHMPCVKLALTRIKDVKQHLNRVHDRLPCPDCVNASAATTTEEEGANCPGGACQEQRNNVIAALDRISQTQREQLSRRLNPKLSFEKQWFQLWEILFPEAKPPATPYLSAPIEEIVGVMKGFWEHHSSRIISSVWQHGPEDTAAVNLLQAADDCSPPPLDQFANWIRATVDSLFAKFVQESKSKRILKPSSHHSQHPNAEESCDHERELTSEEERSVSTEPGESQSLEDLDPGGHDTSSEPFQDRSLEFLLFNAEMEERWLNETLPSAPEQIDDDILTLIE